MFEHITVRNASPQIHQLFLAAAHHASVAIEHPDGRMVENSEHFVPVTHVRRRYQSAERPPPDPFGIGPDAVGGDTRRTYDIGFEGVGPTCGQQFVRPARPVGRGVGTDHDAFETACPRRFPDGPDETVQFGAVVPETRIDLAVSPPEIYPSRVAGGLRRPSDRQNGQQPYQGQFPHGLSIKLKIRLTKTGCKNSRLFF